MRNAEELSQVFIDSFIEKLPVDSTLFFFQINDQLVVLKDLPFDPNNRLYEEVGVIQHHDAITGTERQHVADNYHKRLYEAIEVCKLLTWRNPFHFYAIRKLF